MNRSRQCTLEAPNSPATIAKAIAFLPILAIALVAFVGPETGRAQTGTDAARSGASAAGRSRAARAEAGTDCDATYVGQTNGHFDAVRNYWSLFAVDGPGGVRPASGGVWRFDTAVHSDSLQGWLPVRSRYTIQSATPVSDIARPWEALENGNQANYVNNSSTGRTFGVLGVWHRDPGNAIPGPAGTGPGVTWAPLAGAYSAWMGLRAPGDNTAIDPVTHSPFTSDVLQFSGEDTPSASGNGQAFPGYASQMDQMLFRDVSLVGVSGAVTITFKYATQMSTAKDVTPGRRTGWFQNDPLKGATASDGNFISATDAGANAPADSFMMYVGIPVDDANCVYSDGFEAPVYDSRHRWFDEVLAVFPDLNNGYPTPPYWEGLSVAGNHAPGTWTVILSAAQVGAIRDWPGNAAHLVRIAFRVHTNRGWDDEGDPAVYSSGGKGAAQVNDVTINKGGGPLAIGDSEAASSIDNLASPLTAWHSTGKPPAPSAHAADVQLLVWHEPHGLPGDPGVPCEMIGTVVDAGVQDDGDGAGDSRYQSQGEAVQSLVSPSILLAGPYDQPGSRNAIGLNAGQASSLAAFAVDWDTYDGLGSLVDSGNLYTIGLQCYPVNDPYGRPGWGQAKYSSSAYFDAVAACQRHTETLAGLVRTSNPSGVPDSIRIVLHKTQACFLFGAPVSCNSREGLYWDDASFVVVNTASSGPLSLCLAMPDLESNDGTKAFTVFGTSLVPGASARLTRAGQPDIPATSVQVAADGRSAKLNADLTGVQPGPWSVVATNPDLSTATLTDGVQVLDIQSGGTFQLIRAVPAAAVDNGIKSLSVLSWGLQPGASIKLTRAGQSDIPGTSVQVAAYGLGATFNANLAGALPGAWNVVATNPTLATASLLNGLLIADPSTGPQLGIQSMALRSRIRASAPSQVLGVTLHNDGNMPWDGMAFFTVWVSPNITSVTPLLNNASPAGILGSISTVPAGTHSYAGSYMVPRLQDFLSTPWLNDSFSFTSPSLGSTVTFCTDLYQVPLRPAGAVSPGAVVEALVNTGGTQLGYTWPSFSPGFRPALVTALQPIVQAQLDAVTTAAASHVPLLTTAGFIRQAIDDALSTLSGGPWSTDVSSYNTVWSTLRQPTNWSSFDVHLPDYCALLPSPPGPGSRFPDERCASALCVASVDPNAKVGPPGEGVSHWIIRGAPTPYQVHFENQATASAPAAEVTVTDAINPAAFDLSTFRLRRVWFGGTAVQMPWNVSNDARYLDLRPAKNLLLHVQQSLDAGTGAFAAHFTSIDPATGLPPIDPSQGFLPPNSSPPEGEGAVEFEIMPKSTLSTGAAVSNEATIVFDNNAPIPTPTWTNTIDATAPASAVTALPTSSDSATFSVHWSGSDTGSGVKTYAVYVSEDGNPAHAWQRTAAGTAGLYPGFDGHHYDFYSVAQDTAGNVESAPGSPDASTTVHAPPAGVGDGEPVAVFALDGVRPNPARLGAAVAFRLPTREPARIEVLDVAGRRVFSRDVGMLGPGAHTVELPRGALRPGVCFVRLMQGERSSTQRFVSLGR